MERIKLIKGAKALQLFEDAGFEITPPTLREWALKHGFGSQPGGNSGHYYYDKEKLEAFIERQQKRKN